MRTDMEQFEKIASEYEGREKSAKMKKRVWTIVISAVLAAALLVSSALVLPGLISRNGDAPDPSEEKTDLMSVTRVVRDGGKEYFITDSGKVAELPKGSGKGEAKYDSSEEGICMEPAADSDAYFRIEPAFEFKDIILPHGGEGDQTVYKAGTLTGAELRDRVYFESFLKSCKELIEKDPSISLFDISAAKRIKVTAKFEGVPQSFVKVVLQESGAEGKDPIWTAVTDNKGEAYLYYNVGKQDARVPGCIEYSGPYGIGSYNVRTGDSIDEEVTIEMRGGEKTNRLDLMFMVDTTGSMSDELEYIKTEIKDIIAQITGDRQYDVRTSVNFYRDKGDEYIVHATPFSSDPEEVYEYIRTEHAAGGGDYPEAVHTALDNAINGHEWDDGAVKLCFFVLDAPPHTENEVYESLKASVSAAAAKGVRLIPIVSSGSDSLTEYLMRTFAVMTGGTYTFLTDHSGVGNSHSKPDTDFQYEIEILNDMIVRIAKEYLA